MNQIKADSFLKPIVTKICLNITQRRKVNPDRPIFRIDSTVE